MNVIKSWLWSVVALLAAVLFVTSIGVNDRLTKVLALVVLAIAVIDIALDVMTDRWKRTQPRDACEHGLTRSNCMSIGNP